MQTAAAEHRKIVTKIPADPAKAARFDPNRPLRVAAYCRVSTDLDDQLNSTEKSQMALCGNLCRRGYKRNSGKKTRKLSAYDKRL